MSKHQGKLVFMIMVIMTLLIYVIMNKKENKKEIESSEAVAAAEAGRWWQTLLCEGRRQGEAAKTLPLQVLSREAAAAASDANVFLTETSCRARPAPRAWCAVESWARQNPASRVWYLLTAPQLDDSDGVASLLLRAYGNLRFASLDAGELFKGTALEGVFASAAWFLHSAFPAVVLSDLLRAALVWRFGGFYCDSDTVCLKDTGALRNVASYAQQDIGKISNFCFHFRSRHRFLATLMEVQRENFLPNKWGSVGPLSFTKTSRRLCGEDDLSRLSPAGSTTPVSCGDFRLLPPRFLTPVLFYDVGEIFAPGAGRDFARKFNSTYVLHTYTSRSKDIAFRAGSESHFDVAARLSCPITYELLLRNATAV
ncbi:lactosylceramide 4-alpha-galactosyltransferase-like [Penaeus chinensis]|uniref:lactosylceramide 4-alpha-galactosyltransferase-like n=1 Tax=Penaeus chinensis TaxID=139456 RepID=UPI001FB6BCC2|nr:lactosylceramide 4-alpha-galactosyltransferase-like [Penaeus chinensis]